MWQLESYKEEEVEEEEAVPEENEPQPNKEQRVKNQINHCKVWQICVQRNPLQTEEEEAKEQHWMSSAVSASKTNLSELIT